MPRNPFSPQDQKRISQAIAGAEGRTSGEIVPYYVAASDGYPEAVWRGAAIGMLVTLAGVYGLYQFTELWYPFGMETLSALVIVGGAAAALLVSLIPGLRRILAGRAALEHRVRSRAMQAFVEREIFETRDRTGVLIFISNFERMVIVLGDSGINARVKQEEWQSVVARVVQGIKQGRAADGLLEAIALCGELLKRRGVALRNDDSNELANELIVGD